MEGMKEALAGIGEAAAVTGQDIGNLTYAIQGADTPYQRAILFALNNTGKHIYAGTADPEVVAKRRKANKVARKQRKVNRG